jgi:uncharacterized phiE125 gp8 family phage protein
VTETLVTPPAAPVVSLEELKDHLRIALTVEEQDNLLLRIIRAATDRAERELRRALITQTWRVSACGFPECGEWRIPKPPLQSVASVTYVDTAGVTQTFAASGYVVDAPAGPNPTHGRLVLASGTSWPAPTAHPNAASVTFVAGYGATYTAVPESIRHGVLLLCAQLYEQREPVVVGMTSSDVDKTLDWLWSPYRALVW